MASIGGYHISLPFYRKKYETERGRLTRLYALQQTLLTRQNEGSQLLPYEKIWLVDLERFAHTVQRLYGVPFVDATRLSDAELSKAHGEQTRLRHQKWHYVRPDRPPHAPSDASQTAEYCLET